MKVHGSNISFCDPTRSPW